jgi:hypothetical protein
MQNADDGSWLIFFEFGVGGRLEMEMERAKSEARASPLIAF